MRFVFMLPCAAPPYTRWRAGAAAPDGQQHLVGGSTWRAAPEPGRLQQLPLTPCSRGGRLYQHGSSGGSAWSPAAGFSQEQLMVLDSCSGWLMAATPAAPGWQQQLQRLAPCNTMVRKTSSFLLLPCVVLS
ncbi:unnamed protein product [Closterium sp. NIES-54]